MAVDVTFNAGGNFGSKMDQFAKSAKGVNDEMRRLESVGKRTLNEIMTPQERYNQKISDLNQLLKANVLTEEQHARAVGKARESLERATQSTEGLSKSSDSLSSSLETIALRYASVSTALSAINQSMERGAELSRGLADAASQGSAAYAQLVALEATTSDTSGSRIASQMLRAGAAGNRGDAAQIAFNMLSTGQSGEGDFFSRMLSSGVLAGPESVNTIAKLRGNFGYKSATEAFSRINAAAAFSQTTFDTVASALSTEAAMLGRHAKEAPAYVAALTEAVTAPVAAGQARQFLVSAQRSEIDTSSIGGAISEVQKRIRNGESIFDILGDTQAQSFYNLSLQKMPQIQNIMRQMESAPLNAAEVAMSAVASDPVLAADIARRRAKGGYVDTGMGVAANQLRSDAMRDALNEAAVRQGMARPARGALDMLSGAVQGFTDSPWIMQMASSWFLDDKQLIATQKIAAELERQRKTQPQAPAVPANP